MYQDATHIFTVSPPALGVVAAGSLGYDMAPDFGAGQDPRKAPLVGPGEEFLMRVDITETFAEEGIGQSVFQFHVVRSDAASPSVVALNMIIIGSAMPGSVAVAQTPDIQVGFHLDQLVAGNFFFIRCNPWTAPLGRNAAGATVIGKNLRYLGLIIVQPNYHVADTFASGAAKGYFVKHSDIFRPQDHMYPSAVKHVG